jgi:hypothetical protein
MRTWGKFYRKLKLEGILNGGISSIVVPSTRVTMLSGIVSQ